MSTFAVRISEIGEIYPHPNADRLALARLTTSAYQFVIGKDMYQVGDLVVYFPLDSVLPASIIEGLGLTGKLAGSERNRVKTVRLRSEISQGLVASIEDVLPDANGHHWHVGDDVTEQLGVTKYDPPPVMQMDANLVGLPASVGVYDLENAENFVAQVDRLLDIPVVVTEKLEGSHFGITLQSGTDEVTVLQRRYAIAPIEGVEHSWHRAARLSGLLDKMRPIRDFLVDKLNQPIEVLTLRGELIGPGVQSNIYKLKDHRVYLFEIEANGLPIDAVLFLETARFFDLPIVPVLSMAGQTLRAWLNGKSLREASDGHTVLDSPEVWREGVVIKPETELHDPELGRLVIKQRSPEYLAREK